MTDHCKAPESLLFNENVAVSWKLWKQKFELYLLASGKTNKSDEVKIAILLNLIGDGGLHIYNTFEYEETENKNKLEVILEKFDKYCNPMKNIVYERFKFFKRNQLINESIDQFVTELKQLASTCEFKEKDMLIRDRIVLGVRDSRIQEKLLQNSDLKLNEAIDICRSMENSVFTQKEINQSNVSVIRHKQVSGQFDKNSGGTSASKNFSRGTAGNPSNKGSWNTDGNVTAAGNFTYNCKQCGFNHQKGKCSAFNRICSGCKLRGHYRKMCKRSKVHEVIKDGTGYHTDLSADPDNPEFASDSSRVVWTVKNSVVASVEWFEEVKIGDSLIKLKIDTGSEVNILNRHDFNCLNISLSNLLRVSSTLSSYSGHTIDVIGQINLNCSYNGKNMNILFYILNSKMPKSILGLSAAQNLNIVKNNFVTEVSRDTSLQGILDLYKSVFAGIGKVDKECKITLKPDAEPSVCAARKIPIALKDKVKNKLDEMVAQNLIVPVQQPTDWVHPVVVVPKSNGDIRICMDPRNLNKYVKRELFQIPTYDCLFSQLSGAKIFSLLDCSSAFLQLPLTEESSFLCTIATSFGRYRYLRLPYGLTSSPEIFQHFVHEMLEGLPGVIAYFDDILVFGRSIEEHHNNLNLVLKRIKETGMTLNLGKSKFCVSSINFLGHQISSRGVSPDKNKVIAINSMSSPKNKKELQRFLGMIVYLAKFIPNLSQETSPLRKLLSEQVEFQWNQTEQNCFNRLKELVTSNVTLSYFDPKKPTTLSVDASPYGIGAVISQEGSPVEFASISLTPTQQRYNHIEKELLALVFGCERFHYYLYGRHFKLESDHRPLIGLLKKPIDDMSPRIQRLTIKLLRYQFELNYVPGKQLQVPDTLSRDPVKETINTDYLDNNLRVFSIISTSKENEKRLIQAIAEDETLQKVKYYTLHGWPQHKSSVSPTSVKKYWHIRDEIFVHKDILFFQKRIIIPEALKEEFLNIIHQSHQGVVSCKKRAQEAIYYPGITADIEKLVLGCSVCQMYSKSNQREPLSSHELPELPWQKIGIDFMHVETSDFIVMVDYFSKFAVVNKLNSKTASSVITSLKNIFSLYGLPIEIFSDNGPPFNSKEFYDFSRRYNISLTTSSPLYPKSNGMVERTIQTIKGLFIKALKEKEDPFLAVLNYNATPKQDLPAPCFLLMGRRLRTTLPISQALLKPSYSTKNIINKFKTEQNKQQYYYNKSAKELPKLIEGQNVLVQNKVRDWKPGRIVNINRPNDYTVRVNDADYRRNRIFLKPYNNKEIHEKEEVIRNPKDEKVLEESPKIMIAESNGLESNDLENCTRTKSGRISKPPIRINL